MKNKTNKPTKRWLSIAGNAVFWTMIAGFLFYFVSVTFFPKQAMDLYGFSTYVVATDSMTPEIKVNDYIVVKKVDPDTLVPSTTPEAQDGDIITFYRSFDNAIITHRIVSVIDDGDGTLTFKCMGDNVHAQTCPTDGCTIANADTVREEAIIGKYAYTVPVLGFVVSFLQSPYGIAIVIIDIVVIVAIYLLFTKEKKKTEPQKEISSTTEASHDPKS